MRRFGCQALLAAVVVPMLGAGSAEAYLITWEFGGVIDSVDDPRDNLDGAVQVGDAFAGILSFDSDIPDAYPNNPENGRYYYYGPSMELTLGTLHLPSVANVTSIVYVIDNWNSTPLDLLGLESFPVSYPELNITNAQINLDDNTGTVWENDSLPLSPPELHAFDVREFRLAGYTDDPDFGAVVTGTVTYLTPEPNSLVACALAMSFFCAGKRRRAKEIIP